jgi:amino acid permease
MSDPAEQDPREPTPWWQDQTDVGGIGMARLFAWAALLMGIGALGIAIFAPLAGDALRTVWIAGFGTVAIWVAGLAPPRYRREGVRVSWAVPAAMVLGGLAILVATYAFVVIVAASGGVDLPAPQHWLPSSAPAQPGVPT